jgi:hypothetical protein
MKRTLFYTTAALMLAVTACDTNSSENQTAEAAQEQTHSSHDATAPAGDSREEHLKQVKAEEVPAFSNVPAQTQNTLNTLSQQYLQLKEALVASNAAQASQAAGSMRTSLKELSTGTPVAEQQEFLQQRTQAMDQQLQQLENANDVGQQRDHFARLSKHTTELVSAFGVGKGELYAQYCPMAFDNKGGYWLSDSKEIRNPYYPEQMLTCGRVAREL